MSTLTRQDPPVNTVVAEVEEEVIGDYVVCG